MLKTVLSAVVGVLFSLTLTFAVAAQQDDIRETISRQIEAFKADDFEQAFIYASPTLRRLFQSPENFERMVTNGYPMVWRPSDVEYLELEEYGGALWQKVQIVDQKGFTHLLLYRMQQTEEGWRIAGVQILDAPAATA